MFQYARSLDISSTQAFSSGNISRYPVAFGKRIGAATVGGASLVVGTVESLLHPVETFQSAKEFATNKEYRRAILTGIGRTAYEQPGTTGGMLAAAIIAPKAIKGRYVKASEKSISAKTKIVEQRTGAGIILEQGKKLSIAKQDLFKVKTGTIPKTVMVEARSIGIGEQIGRVKGGTAYSQLTGSKINILDKTKISEIAVKKDIFISNPEKLVGIGKGVITSPRGLDKFETVSLGKIRGVTAEKLKIYDIATGTSIYEKGKKTPYLLGAERIQEISALETPGEKLTNIRTMGLGISEKTFKKYAKPFYLQPLKEKRTIPNLMISRKAQTSLMPQTLVQLPKTTELKIPKTSVLFERQKYFSTSHLNPLIEKRIARLTFEKELPKLKRTGAILGKAITGIVVGTNLLKISKTQTGLIKIPQQSLVNFPKTELITMPKMQLINLPKITTIVGGSPIGAIPTGSMAPFIIPNLSFPAPSISRLMGTPASLKRMTKYQPSLEAVEYKIKGKQLKKITGLELRPIA